MVSFSKGRQQFRIYPSHNLHHVSFDQLTGSCALSLHNILFITSFLPQNYQNKILYIADRTGVFEWAMTFCKIYLFAFFRFVLFRYSGVTYTYVSTRNPNLICTPVCQIGDTYECMCAPKNTVIVPTNDFINSNKVLTVIAGKQLIFRWVYSCLPKLHFKADVSF